MYILIVSATHNEVNSTAEWLQKVNNNAAGNELELLVTGVGSTATAHALTRLISERTPELVIQAGIGGSFKEEWSPGSVVLVKDEVFADLGAFNGNEFDDIFDLGLAAADERPFLSRRLVNPDIDKWKHVQLPFVHGATVNNISADTKQLVAIAHKYNADVESMEGAALHYTCLMEEIPFIQVRAISNFAGERNKGLWKMPEAIHALNEVVRRIVTGER